MENSRAANIEQYVHQIFCSKVSAEFIYNWFWCFLCTAQKRAVKLPSGVVLWIRDLMRLSTPPSHRLRFRTALSTSCAIPASMGPEGTYGRLEGGLCRCRRAGSPGCSGHLWGALGQEMPKNLPILAGQLGQSQCLFQVPLGGAQTDTPLRALTASCAR